MERSEISTTEDLILYVNHIFEEAEKKRKEAAIEYAEKHLTEEDKSRINQLHARRNQLVGRMKRSKKPETLKALYLEWTENEFLLQDAWKFERDIRFHASWHLPHCICPKMDNDDAFGTGYYVVNEGCPIHSHKIDVSIYFKNYHPPIKKELHIEEIKIANEVVEGLKKLT